MTDTFRCGDNAELVAYLYDDCEPGTREAIAAHVARCAVCATELESLRATRRQLAEWAPPETALGFQITRHAAVGATPNVVPFASRGPATAESWWRRPLPAWAQVAAAVAIFASGLALGSARDGTGRSNQAAAIPAAADRTAAAVVTPVVAKAPAVTASDLEALESRLHEEVAALKGQIRVATAANAPHADDQAVMRKVGTLITQSEERQRAETGLRVAAVARQLDAQRRIDLAQLQGSMGQMQQSMGRMQALTGAEARDQRVAVDYLLRVSQRK